MKTTADIWLQMTPENSSTTRIAAIDALRGFCLLGIIYAHYIDWHSGGPLPQEVYTASYGIGSEIARWFANIFIVGKFFALFSFLFGLSFFLQMESGQRSSKPFVARYIRRLVILLFIAAIHQSFWQGDILIIYVPLAFLLLFFNRLSDKWVGGLAVFFILNIPGTIWELINFLWLHKNVGDGGYGNMGAAYEAVIRSGSVKKLWHFNWQTYPGKMLMQVFSGRLSQTLGYFLLGMYVGRKGWLQHIEEYKVQWKSFFKKSIWWSLGLFAIAIGMFAANAIGKLGWEQNQVIGFVFMTIFNTFNFAMVCFYITSFALLVIKPKWQKPLLALAPAGRMALTTYLVQTVIGLLLYFGFGLGWYRVVSPGWNMGIATIVFSLQVFGAIWWFRHFYYGPVEWLWRSGTAGKWVPFSRRALTNTNGGAAMP